MQLPSCQVQNIRLHHVHTCNVTNGRPEKPTTVATLTELTRKKKKYRGAKNNRKDD